MQETGKKQIWFIIIALVFALGLFGYFLAMTVFLPVSHYKIGVVEEKPVKKKDAHSELKWNVNVADSLKAKTIEMLNRRAFLLSRLEMTKIDSISMAVSLKDSTVDLVVQGVTIYSARIQSYTVSSVFNKTNPFVLARWLSFPFTVATHYASIPQVPVLYKKAPKDTIEAMNQLEMDPLKDDIDPVSFRLNLDPKLTLSFEQAEKPEKGTTRHIKAYQRQVMALQRREIFEHLLRFEPIEFIPEIHLVIDKKAARVIYRALPINALVAIQLQPSNL
jgi:hypothetical protein